MTDTLPKIQVDFIHSTVVNFAMQQNHVPVVRKLTMKNCGEGEISNLTIEITSEPEFAIPWIRKIDFLQKGELFDIGIIDLKKNQDLVLKKK